METSCFKLKKSTPALTLILENTIFYVFFCWLYVLILAYQEVVLASYVLLISLHHNTNQDFSFDFNIVETGNRTTTTLLVHVLSLKCT